MISIGKKIQNLRKQKGYSQESIYPKNASQISLIENGKIKNPAKFVLEIIAKNLEISIDTLVSGTTWEENKGSFGSNEGRTFSPSDFNLNMDDNTGQLKIALISYPLFDDQGVPNKFCPNTGKELVTECEKCGKKLDEIPNKFCKGCGSPLFIINHSIQYELDRLDNDELRFLWQFSLSQSSTCEKLIKKIKTYKKNNIIGDFQSGSLNEIHHKSGDREVFDYFHEKFDYPEWFSDDKSFTKSLTIEEWHRSTDSKNWAIKQEWEDYYAKEKLYDKILNILNMRLSDCNFQDRKLREEKRNETLEQYHMRTIKEANHHIWLHQDYINDGVQIPVPNWEIMALPEPSRSHKELLEIIKKSHQALVDLASSNKEKTNTKGVALVSDEVSEQKIAKGSKKNIKKGDDK